MQEQVPLGLAVLLAVLLGATGVLVSALSRRAADGRLGRNPLAGIRTRATMRSDAAWRAGHAAARRLSDVSAAVFVLTGLVGLVVRDAPWFAGLVIAGATGAALLLLVAARRAGVAADAADGP